MVNELATLGDDPNHLNEFGEAPLCAAFFWLYYNFVLLVIFLQFFFDIGQK